jgi:hypothetical protein
MGYWLNFNTTKTYDVTGINIRPVSISVSSGWSLIGPFDYDVATSSVVTNPPTMGVPRYYGYQNGYVEVTTLVAGKGYWVNASQAGSLNIATPITGKIVEVMQAPTGQNSRQGIVIEIEDCTRHSQCLSIAEGSELSKSELPPVPPQGIFDVRFEGNTAVEQLGAGLHAIRINSAVYPITVRSRGMNGKSLWIKDGVGGKMLSERLEEGKALTIVAPLSRLVLSEGENVVSSPVEYCLSQNYPNPFNPSTMIRYSLAKQSHVRLVVFNALGQEVFVLTDADRAAGYHEVRFDAGSLASGVYVYRLQAGDFMETKRMILTR